MKIITLMENRTISEALKKEHGLSLYIETENHKILFDTGASEGFIENAKYLNVDLSKVDIAVISHGHYDHGGGLKAFMEFNKEAIIYIGEGFFDSRIVKVLKLFKANIGVTPTWYNASRMKKVEGLLAIDDELTVFSDVTGQKWVPVGNQRLLKKYSDGTIKPDDFNHEINLLVREKRTALFCGCAHRGIVNIVDRANEILADDTTVLDYTIGGFHLKGLDIKKNNENIDGLADFMNHHKETSFYTCHCTGETAYNLLKESVSHLDEIKTGMTLNL